MKLTAYQLIRTTDDFYGDEMEGETFLTRELAERVRDEANVVETWLFPSEKWRIQEVSVNQVDRDPELTDEEWLDELPGYTSYDQYVKACVKGWAEPDLGLYKRGAA